MDFGHQIDLIGSSFHIYLIVDCSSYLNHIKIYNSKNNICN